MPQEKDITRTIDGRTFHVGDIWWYHCTAHPRSNPRMVKIMRFVRKNPDLIAYRSTAAKNGEYYANACWFIRPAS